MAILRNSKAKDRFAFGLVRLVGPEGIHDLVTYVVGHGELNREARDLLGCICSENRIKQN